MVRISSEVKIEELYSKEAVERYRQGMETDPCGTYLEEVLARFHRLEEREPAWDPQDMYCLWMAVSTITTWFPEEKIGKDGAARRDWQSVNNAIFQDNRLRCIDLCFQKGEDASCWFFLRALTAVAVGDDALMEWIFPAGMKRKLPRGMYPLFRVGAPLLAGLWYQDQGLLDFVVPEAEKYVSSKKPQWERAVIAYLLALRCRDVEEVGSQLQTACKALMRAEFSDYGKEPFSPAHGLYRLAARVLNEGEFGRLPMPDGKSFSKEYALWRNTHSGPPELYLPYPPPADCFNGLLMGDWRTK